MKLKGKHIAALLLTVVAILIYRSFPRFDEGRLMREHREDIPLASLTNFEWDYANLNSESVLKISFYKDEKLILMHGIKTNLEGGVLPQAYFSIKKGDYYSSVRFVCEYDAKIRYVGKEQKWGSNKYDYHYTPLNCWEK